MPLFIIHGELKFFTRSRKIVTTINERPAVKDSIEALGIPHTEVGSITINGQQSGFERQLDPNDRIDVWDYKNGSYLRPAVEKPARFMLDIHLAALARNLRMLGFDTLHGPQFGDHEMLELARTRILVTRSRKLLKHRAVVQGCCIHSDVPLKQTVQLMQRYSLAKQVMPFSRCIRCNGLKAEINPAEVKEPMRSFAEQFERCQNCGQIYWEGSHVERMRQKVALILKKV